MLQEEGALKKRNFAMALALAAAASTLLKFSAGSLPTFYFSLGAVSGLALCLALFMVARSIGGGKTDDPQADVTN